MRVPLTSLGWEGVRQVRFRSEVNRANFFLLKSKERSRILIAENYHPPEHNECIMQIRSCVPLPSGSPSGPRGGMHVDPPGSITGETVEWGRKRCQISSFQSRPLHSPQPHNFTVRSSPGVPGYKAARCAESLWRSPSPACRQPRSLRPRRTAAACTRKPSHTGRAIARGYR